jgi:alpha-glucosidase (family GH31 glycosyl hydrolase)
VIEQGAIHRKVYLPIGHRWQQVAVADDGSLTVQGESFEGGQSITVPVTIADIPLFKRL